MLYLLGATKPGVWLSLGDGGTVDANMLTPVRQGGGGAGMRSPGLAKNAEKCGKKCIKCGKKCDGKCGFGRMVYAPRNPYVSSRLARSGAQSMDGLMEQRIAVVQLKNITDYAQNPEGQKLQLLGQARPLNLHPARAPR